MSLLLSIVVLAYLGIAFGTILPMRWSLRKKGQLLAIRVGIALLLCIAVFEPSFTCSRLRKPARDLPIFVDISESMQLFHTDSLLEAFTSKLQQRLDSATFPRKLRFFSFGDSLVERGPNPPEDFGAARSDLPPLPTSLRGASRLLMVSDGNWTNATFPESYRTADISYLQLPRFAPQRHTGISAVSYLATVPADSPNVVIMEVSGYAPTARSIRMRALRMGHQVASATVRADSGFFRDTTVLTLPSQKVGRFLFRIIAVDTSDSVLARTSLVQTILPSKFNASIHAPVPVLDRRYLSLALQSNDRWTVGDTAGPRTDAFFVVSRDSSTDRQIRRLSPRAVIVYAGMSPSDGQYVPVDNLKITASGLPVIDGSAFDPGMMPPPMAYYRNGGSPGNVIESYLDGILTLRRDARTVSDSVPLLFSTLIGKHLCLVLPIRGFWRWDFWPLELNRGHAEFDFTRRLIALTEKKVGERAANKFYAFPRGRQVSDDSLAFDLILPPLPESQQTIRVSIELHTAKANFDTVMTLPHHHGMSRRTVRLAPQNPGTYSYHGSIETPQGTMGYRDSVTIVRHRTEFHIRGQNTLLLDQIGLPLNPDAPDQVAAFVRELEFQEPQRADPQTIALEQSWWLLLILVFLFGTEWFLRRRWELD